MNNKYTFFILGMILALGISVSAGEIILKPTDKEIKIAELMATSSIDMITATQIYYNDYNTKEIVRRLDKIIYIIQK